MPAFQITTSTFAVGNESILDRIREAGFEVRSNPYGRRLTRDEAIEVLDGDVVALLAGLEPLDRGVLTGSSLKVISRVGSGISNVDMAAAQDLGIAVRNTPDGPTQAVAELTLGAALALLREIPAVHQAMADGQWDKRTGHELMGRNVVVLGLGNIGRRVASLFKAFGCNVIGVDPFVDASAVEYKVLPLEEALGMADILSVHVSGEETLIGGAELGLMPHGAFVLNASRGGVVDEPDLLRAIDGERLGGAWLDVFEDEPYSGPLAGHPRVLATPHIGSYTRECRNRMESAAIQNALDVVLAG